MTRRWYRLTLPSAVAASMGLAAVTAAEPTPAPPGPAAAEPAPGPPGPAAAEPAPGPAAAPDANAVARELAAAIRGIAAAPGETAAAVRTVPEIDKLRTPDSPAFVILGISPSEIQRPTTPRGLAVALGGFVTGGELAIPQNFALEIAPYWLVPHRELAMARYRSEDLLRPLRTLSISVATTETQRSEAGTTGVVAHTDADIGIGFRTMLLQTGGDDACTAKAKSYANKLLPLVAPTDTDRDLAATKGTLGTPEYNAALDAAVQAKVDKLLAPFRTPDCVVLAASPIGFSLDLAGAIDVHAADAKLSRAATSVAGYALWTNMSYDTPSFSGVAVARLAARRLEIPGETVFDTGLRGSYKHGDYALSAEALVRHRWADPGGATTYKADVAIEYQLSEGTWLTLTFGKGFASAPGEAGSLFSLANIQWGIGKPIL
jgi:hypothetical protein